MLRGAHSRSRRSIPAALFLILTLLCLIPRLVIAAPGDVVWEETYDISDEFDAVRDVAIDSQDRLVLVGSNDADEELDGVILRLLPNGTPDSSFGGWDGIVTQPSQGSFYHVVIDANDRILASYATGIFRYNLDGTLDTSFSEDGILSVSMLRASSPDSDVTLDSNGKILMVGRLAGDDPNPPIGVVRINPDGSYDTTFGDDGLAIAPQNAAQEIPDRPVHIVEQADGKIVVIGNASQENTHDSLLLLRFNPDGSMDTSFDGDGRLEIAGLDIYPRHVRLDNQGRLLIAAGDEVSVGNFTTFIARLTPNGAFDTSFGGGDGIVQPQIINGNTYETANGLVVQADGKIVVTGSTGNGDNLSLWDGYVLRLNEDGTTDTSFGGGDGFTLTSFEDYTSPSGIELANDGDIFIGGTMAGQYFAARFDGDAPVTTPLQLVDNGGFESMDSNNKPDLTPWTVVNGSSDKIRCNKDKTGDGDTNDPEDKIVAYAGNCAFGFKSSAAEASRITQNFDLTGMTFNLGDTITLNAYMKQNADTAGKVKLVVTYSDGTAKTTLKGQVTNSSEYALFTQSETLASAAVQKVKLNINFAASTGRLWVDDVSLTVGAATTAARQNVLPLPQP